MVDPSIKRGLIHDINREKQVFIGAICTFDAPIHSVFNPALEFSAKNDDTQQQQILTSNSSEMTVKYPHICQKCKKHLLYSEAIEKGFKKECRKYNINTYSLDQTITNKAKRTFKKKFDKLWSEGVMQWLCCICFDRVEQLRNQRRMVLVILESVKKMYNETDQHAMQDAIMILEREFEKIVF